MVLTTIGPLVILVLIPICVVSLIVISRTLQSRLIIWYTSGMIMSQWMHAMIFVMYRHKEGIPGATMLNVLYVYHVSWWKLLLFSVPVMIMISYGLFRLTQNVDKISISKLAGLLMFSLALSQVAGSSIPKMGGEIAICGFFMLGLLIIRYFLTYSDYTDVSVSQIQSDALTSLGLLVSLISLWWPAALGFGTFLFREYFSHDPTMIQFQMTRYAAYTAWILVGIGLIGWQVLYALIMARQGKKILFAKRVKGGKP